MTHKLTYELLHDLFHYDRESGCLIWKERDLKYFSDYPTCKRWNGKWAGKEAGSVMGTTNKYRVTSLVGHYMRVHRIIWWMEYGSLPDGVIDHIDHNSLNNRIDNLRVVTRGDNNKNREGGTNPFGCFGVYRKKNRYKAQISIRGKVKYLGSFKTVEGAIAARKRAETEYEYHSNHGENIKC